MNLAETAWLAANLAEAYFLPMARRAYADASTTQGRTGSAAAGEHLRDQRWQRFTSREVLRLDRAGPGTAAELNPALEMLDATDKWPGETTREWGVPIRMADDIVSQVTDRWAEYGLPGSGKPIWK